MKKKVGVSGGARVARNALVRLQSNVLLPMYSSETIRSYLSNVIRYSPAQGLRRSLLALVKRAKVLESISPVRRDIGKLFLPGRIDAEDQRLMELQYAVFTGSRELLSDFFREEKVFETCLLYGDYDQALRTLDAIFESTGYSFWLVRSRILVLARSGRLDEMNEYCDECKKKSADSLSPFLLNCFVFLATNPLLHYRRVIRNSVEELAVNGPDAWADLLALMLTPSPIARKPQDLVCFPLLHTLPIIDQVLLVEQLASNNMALPIIDRRLAPIYYLIQSIRDNKSEGRDPNETAATYEDGRYGEVIEQINYPNHATPSQVIQSVNLVAKSIAITAGQGENLKGIVKELVTSLRGLYSLDSSPKRYVDAIMATALQMQHLTFGPSVTLLLYQVLPNQWNDDDRKFAAARVKTLEATPSMWLCGLAGEDDPLISHDYLLPDTQLPRHRVVKRDIRERCGAGDVVGVTSRLNEYKSSSPLVRDYYEIASSALTSLGELQTLVGICGTALADGQAAYSAFPLKMLVDYIEQNAISNVDSLLVINAYVRNVSSTKDYLLNETFEAFLGDSGVRSPSQLAGCLDDQGVVDAQKINVVLRDICTVDVLDFLSIYESSNDVRAERIRLLDQLLSRGGIKPERHRDEVEAILLQSLVDSAATEISVQKIDVNEQELKVKLIEDISSLFHLYKSSEDTPDRDYIRLDEGEGVSTQRAVVVGDRNTTLQKIYQTVRQAFLYDEKHGLDKNLSAEIRHGFFSNLMRSKLDARMLLTEMSDDGEYKSNAYWREVNAILVDDALDELDRHLKWFSAEFNLLLAKAEEWMKVSTSPETSRVFVYAMYKDDFEPLKDFADRAETPSEVLDHIFEHLWSTTEDRLRRVRELLDGELRTDIERLFDDLLHRIEVQRGVTPLADLNSAIRAAKNEVREDISVVKEWFRRGEPLSGRARTVRDLVAISIECYNRVRRIQVKLEFDHGEGLIDISLEGKESKALVVSLMNLYENAISHSGHGTQTPVTLRVKTLVSGGWQLKVSNPTTADVLQGLAGGVLVSIQSRINDPSSVNLVTTEGGTGLRKVVNQLGDVGEKCSLAIGLEAGDFVASITYDP